MLAAVREYIYFQYKKYGVLPRDITHLHGVLLQPYLTYKYCLEEDSWAVL